MDIKVKTFTGYKAFDIENQASVWLENEKGIEIIEVSQSQNNEGEIVLFIFYKNKKKD